MKRREVVLGMSSLFLCLLSAVPFFFALSTRLLQPSIDKTLQFGLDSAGRGL